MTVNFVCSITAFSLLHPLSPLYELRACCRGAGILACLEAAGSEGIAGTEYESHHLRASLKAESNYDSSITLTTRFYLKTSEESGLPSGHLVITPSLTVKFSETRLISYNLTECKSQSDTIITWSLGDDGTSLNSFTLKAYDDIVGAEVLD